MKYISYSQFFCIIFPEFLSHREVHNALKSFGIVKVEPRSAGFFNVEDGAIKVFGKSESLGLFPRENDCEVIEKLLATTFEEKS